METAIRDRELEESKEETKGEWVPERDAEFGSGLPTGNYELKACVTHQGRSADSGHYVGWIQLQGNEWAKLDDDVVSPAAIEDVLKLNGGGDWHMTYLAIYRKIEVIPN
jgi:ubiquitin carboxyl-terminal hydrolase 14